MDYGIVCTMQAPSPQTLQLFTSYENGNIFPLAYVQWGVKVAVSFFITDTQWLDSEYI